MMRVYKLQGEVPPHTHPANPKTYSMHLNITVIAADIPRAIDLARAKYPGVTIHNVQHHGKIDIVDGLDLS